MSVLPAGCGPCLLSCLVPVLGPEASWRWGVKWLGRLEIKGWRPLGTVGACDLLFPSPPLALSAACHLHHPVSSSFPAFVHLSFLLLLPSPPTLTITTSNQEIFFKYASWIWNQISYYCILRNLVFTFLSLEKALHSVALVGYWCGLGPSSWGSMAHHRQNRFPV